MGFLRKAADWVGKAIPNEISKTNSFSKYTQYIPYFGPFLSAAQKGVSAIDNAATAYGDERENGGGDLGTAIYGAQLGIQGRSASPGDYRTGYQNLQGRNFFDVAGQIGNYLPSYQSGDGGGSWDFGDSFGQNGQNVFQNRTLFKNDRFNNLGNVLAQRQPNISMSPRGYDNIRGIYA